MNKNNKFLIFSLCVFLAAVIALVGYLLFWKDSTVPQLPAEEEQLPAMPWEAEGAVQPADYTWADYEALSPQEKEAFFDAFSSVEAFDAWMQAAHPEENTEAEPSEAPVLLPWEAEGAVQPEDYTWADYNALDPQAKEVFFDAFGSVEAFDAWLQANEPQEETQADDMVQLPWLEGGKHPVEYTWEEYEALTPAQKEAFFDAFATVEDFEIWMNGAEQPEEAKYPWEQPGAVLPEAYTWAQYTALTPEEKDAFFEAFESVKVFDAWMKSAQQEGGTFAGKPVEAYTWAEYEALSPQDKELFFDSFASLEAFDAWMQRVNPEA